MVARKIEFHLCRMSLSATFSPHDLREYRIRQLRPLKKYRVPYSQHDRGEIVIDITVRVLPKGTRKVPNSGSSSSEDGVNQEIDRRVESNQGVREMLDCH